MCQDGDEQRARLAYEAALRVLDQQQHDLAEVRARTGTLIAAASLSASFLGTWALDRGAGAALTIVALAALVATLIAGTRALAPRKAVSFGLRGTTVYADLDAMDEPPKQLRTLAIWLDGLHRRNVRQLQIVSAAFYVASASLVIQILAWTLSIAATL